MKTFRWGILGTGNIARKFAKSLHLLDNAILHSAGSRDAERAQLFARECGFKNHYGSYEAFVTDPDLDIVYISSPHSHHMEHTLLALRNGKHVICEKPMSINAAEVEIMISEARSRGLFLMEALWPPFQPSYIKAQEILASGALGRIIHMRGKFAFMSGYDEQLRTYNIGLGGGSLLDVGIYPIMDIIRFMGLPESAEAISVLSPTGADESTSAVFRFHDGRIAEAYSSFVSMAGISTEIHCEKGNLILARGRDRSQHLLTEYPGCETDEMLFTPPAQGYQFEAVEVMRCIEHGLKESTVVPLQFSLDLARTLDAVRKRSGIVYPGRDI